MDQIESNPNTHWVIEVEKKLGNSTLRRTRDDPTGPQAKMFFPIIPTRVEQASDLSGLRIDRRDIRSLMTIAGEAGPCKIVQSGLTSMFARDDMVGLMVEAAILFMKAAILANSAGAETNEVA